MNTSSFINSNPILLSLRLLSQWELGHTLVGRVGWEWSRPSNMPVGWHSCWVCQDQHPRTSGGCPHQALTLLGEVRFIVWRLRYPFLGECRPSPKNFWSCQDMTWLQPCTWTHLKKKKNALCHTCPVSGTNDKYQLSPSSQTWQFRRTLLSPVLTNSFCIYVLFIQYTCSTYFLFFHVFFLAPNRLQQLSK